MALVNCFFCKTSFKARSWGKRGIQRYCSRKCYWKEMKGKDPHHLISASGWNKGMRHPERSGISHPRWKGRSTFDYRERRRFRVVMQKLIFERDDYTCQLCGVRGIDLQVDHIQSWAEYIELRFSMDNCRTLCAKCHYEITFKKPMPKNIKAWGHNLLKGGKQK